MIQNKDISRKGVTFSPKYTHTTSIFHTNSNTSPRMIRNRHVYLRIRRISIFYKIISQIFPAIYPQSL